MDRFPCRTAVQKAAPDGRFRGFGPLLPIKFIGIFFNAPQGAFFAVRRLRHQEVLDLLCLWQYALGFPKTKLHNYKGM
jgi:hypothetical protein